MRSMRIQFGMGKLLLAITCFSFVAAALAVTKEISRETYGALLLLVGALSPLWFPFAFLAYAVGRRSFSVTLVVGLVIIELVAIGLLSLLLPYL